MPLIDHFDLIAPLYDRWIPRPEELPLRDLLGGGKVPRLLDAGGGTGRIAVELTDLAEQIVVFDASLPMLKQADDKSCCQQVCGRTERLPFPARSFDRIIVVDAFHHLGDQRRSLLEFWRALAPGGRLIVEEPDIDTWGVKVVALLERLLLMNSRFVPPEQIMSSLEALGARTQLHRADHTAWVLADKG